MKDEVTGASQTLQVFDTDSFLTTRCGDWGNETIPGFSGTADFFNATRFVTANNGGTAILDVGSPAIGNFFKNTQLAVADGEGSSVVWNSVNDFYFQPGATMQGAALLKKSLTQ